MESTIADSIKSFLFNLVIIEQHGFIKSKSVTTNLLCSLNEWIKQLVIIIYFVYCKACDRVQKQQILFKLGSYGIVGQLLNWISSFLLDRYDCVKVGNCLSNCKLVLCEVLQESVLGLFLFQHL